MTKYIPLLLSFIFVGVVLVDANNEASVAATQPVEPPVVLQGDMGLIQGRLWQAFNNQPDAIADAPLPG